MTKLTEPRSLAVIELLVGHFHQGSGYRVVRRDGVGDWLLIATVSGRGQFAHAGGELVTEAGDWVLIRPGTPHDYGVEASLKRWELVWAHFRRAPTGCLGLTGRWSGPGSPGFRSATATRWTALARSTGFLPAIFAAARPLR